MLRAIASAAVVVLAAAFAVPASAQVGRFMFEDGFECRQFLDADTDGFGNPSQMLATCTPTAGYVPNNQDCNDNAIAVNPNQIDLPDNLYIDANCDGIDGTMATSVFASTLGNATNPGTIDRPLLTVGQAIAVANAAGSTRKTVLVAAGVYAESISLPNGVSVYGQYTPVDWTRSQANITSITPPPGLSALVVNGYAGTGSVQGLSLRAGNPNAAGQSPTAVRLINAGAGLSIRYNQINAVAGANGLSGVPGPTVANGVTGGGGQDGSSASSSGGGRGLGAVGTCGAPGGDGGTGGYDMGAGTSGVPSAGGGGGGPGGASDPCNGGGNNGQGGMQGPIGVAGSLGGPGNGGMIAAGLWVSFNGTDGTDGTAGAGGGGGGGGGGGQGGMFCNADRGGGGGGGGSGGCGGKKGTGGGGGGASIGVLLDASSAVISNNTFNTGKGGNGGAGGDGGAGGGASGPSPFGAGPDDAGAGGPGASGRAGGPGGCGGGGAGGHSVGILYDNTSTLTQSGNTFTIGVPGDGGLGSTTPTGGVCSPGVNGTAAQTLLDP